MVGIEPGHALACEKTRMVGNAVARVEPVPKPPRPRSFFHLPACSDLLDALEVILGEYPVIEEEQRRALCRTHVWRQVP